jgi:PAS domain-containing protein
MQYVPLLDDQGEIQQILGITHDITERKQAEEAARRSEKQIRRILDGLFSFVGVMTPDGILIEANRTALAAAALHPEDVLGKPFAETYWWSYSVDVQNQLRAAIERATTGETVRYDVVVRIRDNQWLTIDFTLYQLAKCLLQITRQQ